MERTVSTEADESIMSALNSTNANDEEVEDLIDESVAPVRYEITSFGIDFDVDGLNRRLQRGEIIIPGFQRNYIWNIKDASRFIESLLLGLPVPGIFLSRDIDSGKYVVIDGQQRLKSIQFFYQGVFNPSLDSRTQRVFKLTGVQKQFEDMTYADLDPKNEIDFNNSVIHATVVKQDTPAADDTSIYHIFDRINSGGIRLTQQEIRSALYHGKLIDKLDQINNHPAWRSIFGRLHSRQRDQELILRFIAFFFEFEHYESPLSEFLTRFLGTNRNPSDEFLTRSASVFSNTMNAFKEALGDHIFRLDRALNAAIFDSMSVGLARKIISSDCTPPLEEIAVAYQDLLDDQDYRESVSRATAREQPVAQRMRKAIDRFATI